MFEIGTSLREARVRRRLDLTDAEHDTKIRSKYLLALENEDFSVLPGSVYARGFLRTYSQYLGLNPQMYIDEYNSRFGQFEEAEESLLPGRGVLGRDNSSRLSFVRVTVIVLLIAMALLIWAGLQLDTAHKQREQGVFDKIKIPLTPRASEIGTRPPTTTPKPVPVPVRAVLTVAASGGASSWMKVQLGSATGKLLFAGTLDSGKKKVFTGRKLFVTIGYPPALTVSIPHHSFTSTAADTLHLIVTPTRIRSIQCRERCL